MDILVDEQPYPIEGSPDQTVTELAEAVCQPTADRQARLIVSLRCDGEEVPQEGLAAVLESPINRFDRLELLPQPVLALVHGTISQASSVFEETTPLRHKCADLLAEGQHDGAMTELSRLCSIWKQVQESVLVCARAMELDLDALRIADVGLPDLIEQVKRQLEDLREALESRDTVLVGDILRYELEEPFDRWQQLLHHLEEEVERRRPV